MTKLSFIFYILSFLTIFFGFLVVTSKNPISSVVNLVATFVSCAGIWILLEIHLLGWLLVIVYVGAIAILFIFVIMMMDIRNITEVGHTTSTTEGDHDPYIKPLTQLSWVVWPLGVIWLIDTTVGGVILPQLWGMTPTGSYDHKPLGSMVTTLLQGGHFYQDYFSIWEIAQRNLWDSLLISLDLIHSIGYILYTDLLSLLIIVSLILLMIMIGVIVSTTTGGHEEG